MLDDAGMKRMALAE